MKDLEPVYREINRLLIEKLPNEIEKINQEKNDGIILEKFNNKNIEESCAVQPCFECEIGETELSEKDRIIENININLTLEIKLKTGTKLKIIRYNRYVMSIFNTFKIETELWSYCNIIATLQNKIKLKFII